MRILTISDIHYKDEYKDNISVKEYLKSFKDKIIDILLESPLDAVFITGDLAYAGKTKEYKRLIISLRDLIPEKIPIYAITGNHDVKWMALEKAIGKDVPLEKIYEIEDTEITNDLEGPDSKYAMVFEDFKTSFIDEINNGITNKWVFKFCEKNYSGYVYNPDEKILFLLLNSSWYSFGPGVIESYYLDKVKKLSPDELKTQLFRLIGDVLSQKGKQSYFLKTYPFFDEINSIITNDSEVRVITLAHHPPSWLKWIEQHGTDKDAGSLAQLIEITDLLITGHDHTPVYSPSILRDGCYHMSNGAFLDYNFIDNKGGIHDPISKFPNNWFNIIEITKFRFSYKCYQFKTEKIKSSGIKYNYYWDQINKDLLESYDFFEKIDTNKPVAHLLKKAKKNVEEIDLSSQIFWPSDLNQVIDLLKDKRRNQFYLPSSQKSHLNRENINLLKSDSEVYILIINNLDEVSRVLGSAVLFKNLKENTLFENLITEINKYPLERLPVLAFYDFISLRKEHEYLFERYENERFILFQSFKHNFFSKFKELFKFTELNITFDIIIY